MGLSSKSTYHQGFDDNPSQAIPQLPFHGVKLIFLHRQAEDKRYLRVHHNIYRNLVGMRKEHLTSTMGDSSLFTYRCQDSEWG